MLSLTGSPVFPCLAPMASALSARYSHRAVVMIGGLLSCVGMVAGAYAQNLVQLYITVGLLTGKWSDSIDTNTHRSGMQIS